MKLGIKFSLMTVIIVIVFGVLLEATGFIIFRKELYRLSRNLFIEKVERLILLAYEQDEMFFEGVYVDDLAGRKRVKDKVRIIYRNQKDKVSFPFVINSEGRIVIHPEYEEDRLVFNGSTLAILKERIEGDFEYLDGNTKRWCVFKKYAPWGWIFCMTTTIEKRDAAILSFIWGSVCISLLVLILAILLIMWLSNQLVRPLGSIVRTFEMVAQGLIPLTNVGGNGGGIDEIEVLRRSFNTMSHKLRDTMDGLRLSEEKYRSLFENAIEGIFRTTMDGKVVLVSPSLARIMGYDSAVEFVDNVVNLRDQIYVVPQQRDIFLQKLRVNKRVTGFEIQCYRKDRRIIWVSIHAHIIEDDSGKGVLIEGMLEDISERKAAEEKLVTTMVSRDALLQEVEIRKRVEDNLKKAYLDLQRTQEQLLQSQKMASVGQLAAGVAHEINNPAGFVTSNLDVFERYVEVLKRYLEQYSNSEDFLRRCGNEEAEQIIRNLELLRNEHNLASVVKDLPNLIRESLDGMQRIQRIVADLRSFSHSDTGKMEEIDIHEVIQTALNIVGNEIKYKTEIIKEYSKIPIIRCYAQQLSQVFLNLLLNAAQSITDKGKITLRTFMDSDMVVIEVVDTGCGMSEDVRRRVFEPFFTTKPVGKGTGLGLSLVYNIIEKHKGIINVDSVVGEGSKFTIKLPIRQEG